MSDLARTLAFAFRRKGAQTLAGGELRLLLAYDLRWFAPEDAKRVVARGIETGLLAVEGDALRPAFDLAQVDVPVNFRPGLEVLEETPGALPAPAPRAAAPAPLAAPVAAPVAPSAEVERAAEDERRRRGLMLGVDAARLVVRRRAGERVEADAAALEAAILSGDARPRSAAP